MYAEVSLVSFEHNISFVWCIRGPEVSLELHLLSYSSLSSLHFSTPPFLFPLFELQELLFQSTATMEVPEKPLEVRTSHESRLEKGNPLPGSHVLTGFDTNIESLPAGYFTSLFFVGTMLAAALGLLAGVAGFGYAAPILAVINADIGPDPNLAWVGLVYTLMLAVFLTLVGRVSDVFGRRWVFGEFVVVGGDWGLERG